MNRKILIIKDDKDRDHWLTRRVEAIGFEPLSAENVSDGLNTAAAHNPSLILLDLMMPHIDGLNATRLLRAHPRTHKIPILVVSALPGRSDVDACMEAGCTDSIGKPFSFRELEAKVRNLILS